MPLSGGYNAQENQSIAGPWGPQQPYMKDIYQRAQDLFGGGTPEYYAGSTYAAATPEQLAAATGLASFAGQESPFLTAGQQFTDAATGAAAASLGELQRVGMGKRLSQNPYLDEMFTRGASRITDAYQQATAPSIDALFAKTGGGGGTPHALAVTGAQEALGQSLGDFGASLFGNAYNTDANRQMSALQAAAQAGLGATSMAPKLDHLRYTPFAAQQQAGDYLQQLAQGQLDADIDRHNYAAGGGDADWLTHYANMILGHPVQTVVSSGEGSNFQIGGL